MSRPRVAVLVGGLVALAAASGCEQNSAEWFPHMKKQPAVQAFEDRGGWLPPEGVVDITGGEVLLGRLDIAGTDALVNPKERNDLRSLQNGQKLYGIYCQPCHGPTGMGDGPVSALGAQLGPFVGVFPLVGLTTSRSDGYIYNVIRQGGAGTPGFRMPSYGRVPQADRWDIVNYVRYLDRKGGRP